VFHNDAAEAMIATINQQEAACVVDRKPFDVLQ
jgi:hypothetical protein